jgi:hypothetical protein
MPLPGTVALRGIRCYQSQGLKGASGPIYASNPRLVTLFKKLVRHTLLRSWKTPICALYMRIASQFNPKICGPPRRLRGERS